MDSTADILNRLRMGKDDLQRRFPIQRLALFGSYARGEQTEESDVDILVEVDPSIGLRFVRLADEIEQMVGRRTEVVSRRALKDRSWNHIRPDLIDV